MSAADAPKVFISYRREETAGHAGRLYDELAERLGERNVFMDVDLAPGIDFVERITTAVDGCRALLVVMGPRWATGADGDGQPRIADPDDFVRLEVETALRSTDVTVIPVLVAGAQMPAPELLPEPLRPLARRNAIELSDQRWRYDVGRLLDAVTALLSPRRREQPAEPGRGLLQVLEGTAVAALAGALMLASFKGVNSADSGERAAKLATTIIRNALVWAGVGLVLASWLAWRRGARGGIGRAALSGLLLGAFTAALGSALFGATRFLPSETPGDEALRPVAIIALALVGAGLGSALGRTRRPPHGALGLWVGAAAGALTELLALALDAPALPTDALETNAVATAAFQAAAIAAAVLATLVAVERPQERAASQHSR